MNTVAKRLYRDSRATVAVGVITLVALALRLAAIDESFFGDELFTYDIATRPDLHAVLAGVRSDMEITPPLYFIVAWTFQHLGDPFLWLRMPSLLAGVATVPLVYVLGLRTVGRRAAMVGAGLFALSPIAIFYATEARAYALMTLLVVLSALALLRAIDTNDWRWWAALALFDAAAMYSHYTSIFVLATQAGWALFTKREMVRPLLAAHAGAALLYLPWLPGLLEDRAAPAERVLGVLAPFTAANAVRFLGRLVAGGPFAPLSQLPGTPALALLGVAAAIGLGGFTWRGIQPGRRVVPERVVLITLLALAAPVGAGLASALGDDMFVPRNLISSLPALALAFAALLVALPRKLAAVTVALAFSAFALGAGATFEKRTQRSAYKDAAAFVNSRAGWNDVALEFSLIRGPARRALAVQLDPALPLFRLSQESNALLVAEAKGGRIFYVGTEAGPLGVLVPKEVELGYRAVERHTWVGIQDVTVVVYEPR